MAGKLRRRDWDEEIALLRNKLRELTRLTDEGRETRIQRATGDFEFFCATYFPHLVTDKTNLFHKWVYREAPSWGPRGRHILAAPRGNSKTTLLGRLFVLWRVVRADIHNIPLISDTLDQAMRSLEAISLELEENPRLMDDFPGACGRGRIWQAEKIVTKNNVYIMCAGAGKKIRGINFLGKRPELILLDDLENDENVRTKKQRDKLEHWFSHTVMHLGPPDGSAEILYIGTWLHYDGLMARVVRRGDFRLKKFRALIKYPEKMELWEQWERIWRVDPKEARRYYELNRDGMDYGAEVLWPGVQPLYALMEARASDRSSFNAELQNEPLDDATRIFSPETMKFWDQLPPKLVYYGACDPALGKERGDFTALVVVGRDPKTGIVYEVDARIERTVPHKAIREMIEMQRRWRCVRWAIEDTAFQEFFRVVLVKESLLAGVPVPAVGVKNRAAKDIRIESLAPHIENGSLLLCRSHVLLVDQLQYYPMADHDDGPDALEMGWRNAFSAGARIESGVSKPGAFGRGRGY